MSGPVDVVHWLEELKETTEIVVVRLIGFKEARVKVDQCVVIDFHRMQVVDPH